MLIAALRRNRQWVDSLEVQHRLGRQLDLLSLLGGRHSGSSTCPGCRTNCGAFATSKDATENGAGGSTDTYLGRGVLALAISGAGPLIRLNVVRSAVRRERRQFQRQDGIAG